jgi:hypothetical protein
MSEQKRREIKRFRRLLQEIAAFAEEEEMEEGLPNAVKRYNAIIRHLEEREILPPSLFPMLNEERTRFGEIGAECRMLAGYLEELEEEEEEEEEESSGKKFDFGHIVALAPFLGQSELKKMVKKRMRFRGEGDDSEDDSDGERPSGLNMHMLVGLAPHLSSDDLADLVRTCLANTRTIDPGIVIALAPHMNSKDLGKIIREHLPQWFNEPNKERSKSAPNAPDAPSAPEAPSPPSPGFPFSATAPPAPPSPPAPPEMSASELVSLHTQGASQAVSRTDEERARLQEIVARLREEDVSDEERAELMNQLESLVQKNLD